MPIEWFVTTLIDWTIFLMTRTKLASVGFVAARNCMRQQVLDDAKSLPTTVAGRSDSSYALNSARYYSVIQSTTPVLLQYYKALYHKVLPLHYSVPQSTTPYYKALLQYYSILQSATPALLRTTKYYSSTTKHYFSTTPYYKVLLQYYSVPQSTTPALLALLCTTKYYSVLQNTTSVLLYTKKRYSSTTPYYKVLLR